MQAVIMAAGMSSRTFPITLTKPKPLVKVANKTILERSMENLQGLVDEVLLIVGYKKEMIEEYLKGRDYGFKVTLVEQKEQLGTGHALLQCKPYLKGKFVSMGGDDYFSRRDIEKCLKHEFAILTRKVDDPSKFGVCFADRGILKKIVEKPKVPISYLGNAGLYVLNERIFDALRKIKKSSRGEYEVTDAINLMTEVEGITVVEGEDWVPGSTFKQLFDMNRAHLDAMEAEAKGKVMAGAFFEGKVSVGEGSVIRPGSYIEGPVLIGRNCTVGPNCYIRPYTTIGDGCRVGHGVELKNCIVGDEVHIAHLSYFGDSILGDDVNVGGGTIAANLRHDGQNVKTWVNGDLVDTGMKKFGTVIGDGAKLGVNTVIYPGRKIWPGMTTLPGDIVKKDVK